MNTIAIALTVLSVSLLTTPVFAEDTSGGLGSNYEAPCIPCKVHANINQSKAGFEQATASGQEGTAGEGTGQTGI